MFKHFSYIMVATLYPLDLNPFIWTCRIQTMGQFRWIRCPFAQSLFFLFLCGNKQLLSQFYFINNYKIKQLNKKEFESDLSLRLNVSKIFFLEMISFVWRIIDSSLIWQCESAINTWFACIESVKTPSYQTTTRCTVTKPMARIANEFASILCNCQLHKLRRWWWWWWWWWN